MAYITSLLLPDHTTTISLNQIGQVVVYQDGVGILNLRGKMIGWIPCTDQAIAAKIVAMIDQILNNPGRNRKPDWSMLKEIKEEV